MRLLMLFLELIMQLLGMGGGEKGGSADKRRPGKFPEIGQTAGGKGGRRNGRKPKGRVPRELKSYKKEIDTASALTGIPADIISAIIWQESRGKAQVGSTNANGLFDLGLMQVNPNTFNQLKQEYPVLKGRSLKDPQTNILAGSLYLKDMLAEFGGNLPYALRAYNSGPDGVVPGDPNATKGTGDPSYVVNVFNNINLININQELPA